MASAGPGFLDARTAEYPRGAYDPAGTTVVIRGIPYVAFLAVAHPCPDAQVAPDLRSGDALMIATSTLSAQGHIDSAAAGRPRIQPLPSVLTAGLSMQDMLRVNAARPHFRTVKGSEPLYFQGDECRNIYVL